MINLQLVDKKERYMSKNNGSMRHSIAIIMLLAMGVIVCSAIAESSNIIFEGYWVSSSSSYHDTESLKKCIQECKVRHPLNHDNKATKTCTMHCCVEECRRRLEPRDPKKFTNCVENLFATYVKSK
ncbi:hypothetical protein PIB30_017864 [Stylosanthes scabra]|uniref:Plant thionin family protein n=1 Tax=Stylosanthes scabra TaxID=79078 RepID=A0ABU6X9L4_9FABA|nr:hypothetical protein [Stylosanthes scabra]